MNAILKKIKAGNSLLVEALPETYINDLSLLVREFVPQPEEGSPRALIITSVDEDAHSIAETLKPLAKELDLTVDVLHEKGNKLKQRNDLFDGTEIVVGNVKRVTEMYFQNGFNIGKLKLFILIKTDEIFRKGQKGNVVRITESLPKCKTILFTTHADEEKIASFVDEFFPGIGVME